MKVLSANFRLIWALTIIFVVNWVSVTQAQQAIIVTQTLADEIVPIVTIPNVVDFAKSPLDDVFVIMDMSGNLYLWNAQTQDIELYLEGNISTRLNSLRWSPNGNYIVAGFDDGGRVWDAQTGRLLHLIDVHPVAPVIEIDSTDDLSDRYISTVSDMIISPDETLLITSHIYDTTVLVWDLQTFEITGELQGHRQGIDVLEFSPDGSMLAAGSEISPTITVWNIQPNQKLIELSDNRMSFSPDGTMFASGFGRLSSDIGVWDTSTWEQIATFRAPLNVDQINWVSNSNMIAGFNAYFLLSGYLYTGSSIRNWNVLTGELEYTVAIETEVSVNVDLAEDENLIGVASDTVLVWNQATDDRYNLPINPDFNGRIAEITAGIYGFAVNSDQSYGIGLAIRLANIQLFLWDVTVGTIVRIYAPEADTIYKLAWLTNQEGVISTLSGNGDFSIRLLWQ